MNTVKVFWKYLLNFLILFLFVSVFTYCTIRIIDNKNNKSIECIAQESAPKIEITECSGKKIKGVALNDTENLINLTYIKATFYDEHNNVLGNEYHEIKFFNAGEKSSFEIEHQYKNAVKVEVISSDNKE